MAWGAKTMTTSLLHDPPRPSPASQIAAGAPPATATSCSLPSAKRATKRLSGDQKGKVAPSVPGSGCAVSESKGRSQNRIPPRVPDGAPSRLVGS
jgi:hypothetical protein